MSRIVRSRNDQNPKTVKMAVIGKIKIGEKKPSQNGGERPSAIDYFKPFADGMYEKLFREAYGEKPTTIPVFFVSEDMAQSCPCFYELRDGTGKRVANGDGITFNVATKLSDNTVSDLVVTPPDIDKWMNDLERTSGGKWKEVLVLRFIIPNIPILGVWEFRTGGDDSTIPNIVGTIDTVKAMAGRISGIPFDLSVKIVKSDKAGSSSKYPVVSLVCNISQESAELVKGLPIGTFQTFTENSIKGLGEGAKIDNIVDDWQLIDATPTTIDSFNLTDKESFTAAAHTIAKMKDNEQRKDLAIALADKAQLYGFSWSKEHKQYI